MYYEFNLLHHVSVVAKRLRAAAAETAAAHVGDDNTPSGPTGRGVKSDYLLKHDALCTFMALAIYHSLIIFQ